MAVSMYSMTSQREASPVSSGSDYLKRPLHHDRPPEVDSDLEPAVKVKCSSGAGGGRRKQSKPIRVRSDLDAAPVEDILVDIKMGVSNSPSAAEASPAAIDACREAPLVEALSYDVDDQKSDPDHVAAPFPTKYHQLGSELKQEVGLPSYESNVRGSDDAAVDEAGKTAARRSDVTEEARLSLADIKPSPHQFFNNRQETDFSRDTKSLNHFPGNFYQSSQGVQMDQSSASKPDCLPTNLSVRSMKLEAPGNGDVYPMPTSGRSFLSDTDMTPAEMQEAERYWENSDGGNGAEKSRIFHPDAYCDICDREFCNKYFLKTHRANKHGIYDGSSGDPAGNSNPGAPPAVSGMVLAQSGLPVSEVANVALPLDREHTTPNSANGGSAASLAAPAVVPLPQLPSASGFGVLPFDDAPPPPQPQQPQTVRGSDMEDYCDICQKHFCNKYYLRKHRQDVHGLMPADVSARRSQTDLTRTAADVVGDASHFPLRVSSSTASSTLPAPTPSALSNFPMFLPPPFGAPLPVVSPFLPAAAGLGFGSLPFGADAAGSKLATSSSSTSQQQQQQQAHHQLAAGGNSSLMSGMLNADAYMDLFRKELLGGYLMSNGDRDATAAFAAVAAAAAAASAAGDPSVLPPPPRLAPPLPTGADSSSAAAPAPVKLETGVNSTPDTFAEMLQRIGARIGKKSDGLGLGALQHDLFRLNGLGLGGRLPASTCSSSSSSSRLVDRVVCDLCNKEVCNKYFLKTHKMKVHGWDPNTSTVPTSVSSAPAAMADSAGLCKSEVQVSTTQPQPPLIFHPPDNQLDKPLSFPTPESCGLAPKDAELQQMGIDPEAYCEICRKEFCSKYFLRTHRQNIHGIHDTTSSSSPAGHSTSLFSGSVPSPFAPVVLAPPTLPTACLPSTLSSNPPSSTSSMFLFGGAAGLANNESSSGSSEGHVGEQRSWKWKEPVNATRVSCTLCNKVLCNKYFLRTHMAKRHGVTVDTRLQPPQVPIPPPPPGRDLLHPPSNGLHQLGVDPQTADPAEQKDADSCMDVAKAGAVNLVLSGSRASTDIQTVTARTWHVPPDDATLQTDSSNSDCINASLSGMTAVKQHVDDTVKCPLCTGAMSDRDVLLRHLTTVHHVDEHMSTSLVAAAASQAPTEASGSPGSSSSDGFVPHHPSQLLRTPPNSGAGGGAGAGIRRRRQFRCVYCRERFRTRVHCELHARAAHPRATGSCVEVTPAVDSVELAASPPPPLPPPPPTTSLAAPLYATPLDADDASRAQMLPFILRESITEGSDPVFSTALVYLPTLRRLTSPTTVSFTLTPILQP